MHPASQTRELLEASRRAGIPFGDAWPAALAQVDDVAWRNALTGTARAWLSAYERREPERREQAVDLLARGVAGEPADLDASAHCPICDERLDPRSRSAYCGKACAKTAMARREPLDVAA